MCPKKYNRRFIITGGPTREWIDPVRFISNPSTGKMGTALAVAARDYSDDVIFIHGPMHPCDLEIIGDNHIPIETTEEMRDAVLGSLSPDAVIIMSAAPADYAPVHTESKKIKKGADSLSIVFRKTPDILTEIARLREHDETLHRMFVVGFAAETNDIEEYAKGKLIAKNLDMICVNDVTAPGAGFATDTNIISVYRKDGGSAHFSKMSKSEIAKEILKIIVTGIDG